jgi:hypothetical protein
MQCAPARYRESPGIALQNAAFRANLNDLNCAPRLSRRIEKKPFPWETQ